MLLAGRRTLAAARGRWLAFLVVGASFTAIPFTLIAVATLTLPAGFTALLNAATPLFTAVLAWWSWASGCCRGSSPGSPLASSRPSCSSAGHPSRPGRRRCWPWPPASAPPPATPSPALCPRALSGVGAIELATGTLAAGALVALPVAMLTGAPGYAALDGVVALLGVGTLSTAMAWPVFFRVLATRRRPRRAP